MGDALLPAAGRLEAERAELDAVLSAELFGRTNNLVRLLNFVCEKYFNGEINEIKEYTIAVEALGRPQNFDPQVDTIVRVTAHGLRKRLEEYYRTEGAEHALQICLPAGHYVPSFVPKSELKAEGNGHSFAAPPPPAHANGSPLRVKSGTVAEGVGPNLAPNLAPNFGPTSVVEVPPTIASGGRDRSVKFFAFVVTIACLILAAGYWLYARTNRGAQPQAQAVTGVSPANSLRALIGDERKPYVDGAGFSWEGDRFCSGGDSFAVTKQVIRGTGDPQLFVAGRRGAFRCSFPLPPGKYEMHLLFAETEGLLENARTIGFSLNGNAPTYLDIVDEAGDGDTAVTKVYTGVEPQSDGKIHLDFNTPVSFLNAVEILPSPTQSMLPVRILAGRTTAYHDPSGAIWLPDRFYSGGRPSKIGNDVSKVPDSPLFEGQRIGHFHYAIPVALGGEYTLRLYFIERWFGIQNQNVGGPGSRVFDVSSNGAILLKDFDIMAEGGSGSVVKTFSHLKPTAQGKIEIYFTPGVNYPSISAIEVEPE